MEQIDDPGPGPWKPAGPRPDRKTLPGFTYLAWLAVIASAAGLQILRSAAGAARADGWPWTASALDALVVVVAIGLTVAALVVAARRVW